jgi:hypothetical protein
LRSTHGESTRGQKGRGTTEDELHPIRHTIEVRQKQAKRLCNVCKRFGIYLMGEGLDLMPVYTDSTPPSVVLAIHDATGVWFKEQPVTPEKIWRALKDAGKWMK